MIRLPAGRKIIFDTNVYLEAIAMLCTLNGEDFRLIARYETFSALQEIVWAREPGVCLSPLRRAPR